jgi:hypothetical protein
MTFDWDMGVVKGIVAFVLLGKSCPEYLPRYHSIIHVVFVQGLSSGV